MALFEIFALRSVWKINYYVFFIVIVWFFHSKFSQRTRRILLLLLRFELIFFLHLILFFHSIFSFVYIGNFAFNISKNLWRTRCLQRFTKRLCKLLKAHLFKDILQNQRIPQRSRRGIALKNVINKEFWKMC